MISVPKKFKSLFKNILKRPSGKIIFFAANKKIYPKQIELILRESIYVFLNSRILEKSTQLAYSSIMSIVPLIAILFTLIHSIHGFDNLLSESINPIIRQQFGSQVGEQIISYIQLIINNLKLKELGIISFVTFLFTIILLILNIENIFDDIMNNINRAKFFSRLSKCWLIITISPFILALTSLKSNKLISIFIPEHSIFFNSYSIQFLRFMFGFSFQALFFMILFYIIPSKKLKFRSVLGGGLSASFLFEILQYINEFLVKRAFSSNHIYGSVLLLIVVFLLWLRLLWGVILIGACMSISTNRILFPEISKKIHLYPIKGYETCYEIYKIIFYKFKFTDTPKSLSQIHNELTIDKTEILAWTDYLISEGLIQKIDNNNEIYFVPTYNSLNKENENFLYLKSILNKPFLNII